MKHAAVVPDHDISRSPAMMMNAWRLAGEIHEIIEQGLRFVFTQAWNGVGMPADQQ